MATGPAMLSHSPSPNSTLPLPPPRRSSSISRWRWRLGDGGRGGGGARVGRVGPPLGPAVTGSGMAGKDSGKVALGFPPLMAAGPSLPVLQPPLPESPPTPAAAALAESPGQGSFICHCALPSRHSPLRVTPCFGAASPRVRPFSYPAPGADCPQCAWGGRTIEPEGLFFGHAGREVSTRG